MMSTDRDSSFDIENERRLLEQRLNAMNNSELQAFDLQLTLLRSAHDSYKRESVLKPCPQFFNELTREEITQVFRLPPVHVFLSVLDKFTDLQILLLNWLLTRDNFTLKPVSIETASSLIKHQLHVPDARFAFEVQYNEQRNERFDKQRDNHKYETLYAYHGTRFDNLHSILNIGFLGHMNKISLFGSGTYFSVEPSVSLHYSPFSHVWQNSSLGKRLSCLLLCEIIDHPDHVKRTASDGNNDQADRRVVSDTQAGAVPEKYVVVTSNDFTRLKYIFIYAESNELNILQQETRSAFRRFFSAHRFYFCLLLYFFLLLAVGFFNSNLFKFYWRILKKRSNYLLFGSWHVAQ